MALKTDYKDDAYEGKRKYLLIDNGDGTYSLDDVTDYKVIGDFFNSFDVNSINTAVNANTQGLITERETTDEQINETNQKVDSVDKKANDLKKVQYVTFSASKWSSSAPYLQTVNVDGIKESDEPIISLYLQKGESASLSDSKSESYGYVNGGITGNGTLTLYCNIFKPTSDFTVLIKGV